MSLHSASSLAFSGLLNMSPTMDMPGDHCDIPPKSAWLNWAIRPPPLRRALSTTPTAAGDTECFFAIRSTRSLSLTDIFVVPGSQIRRRQGRIQADEHAAPADPTAPDDR